MLNLPLGTAPYWKASRMLPGASYNLMSTALNNLSPLSSLLAYFSIGEPKKQQQQQHAQQKEHAQHKHALTEIRIMVTKLNCVSSPPALVLSAAACCMHVERT